jgi:hypothetical protein
MATESDGGRNEYERSRHTPGVKRTGAGNDRVGGWLFEAFDSGSETKIGDLVSSLREHVDGGRG